MLSLQAGLPPPSLVQSGSRMLPALRRLPNRLARHFRARVQRRLFPNQGLTRIPIGRPHAGGVLDSVEVNDDSTLAVLGWAADERAFMAGMQLVDDELRLIPAHVFRVPRPDLATLGGHHPERLGLVAEFVLPAEASGRLLSLAIGGSTIVQVPVPLFQRPHYAELYYESKVWHRDDIYGVGPPQPYASREILDLCADLHGPVLDFGCGAGALLSRLRANGLETFGLELDNWLMRESTMPAAVPYVTFYDGTMPSPFDAGAFATVTCCEVLEHIPNYQEAVTEIARLSRERVLITVPDMSSIPRGMRHGVVPWHLLERSHLNFFSQASLAATLAPHFSRVRFARIGEIRCERLRFYTSLVAICDK